MRQNRQGAGSPQRRIKERNAGRLGPCKGKTAKALRKPLSDRFGEGLLQGPQNRKAVQRGARIESAQISSLLGGKESRVGGCHDAAGVGLTRRHRNRTYQTGPTAAEP